MVFYCSFLEKHKYKSCTLATQIVFGEKMLSFRKCISEKRGISYFPDIVKFENELKRTDLIITAEGRLDARTPWRAKGRIVSTENDLERTALESGNLRALIDDL